jgi:rubrerythrin
MTLAKIPILLEKVKKEDLDKQILRTAILAELDAINLYEQMANLTDNKNLKMVLMDVAKEEKEHVGEFQYLLLKHDPQQQKELDEGMEEVKELLGEK